MSKNPKRFVCENCGFRTAKLQGKCENCNSWNTIHEEISQTELNQFELKMDNIAPLALSNLEAQEYARIKTTINEFNHVCGSGIVPGAVMLIAGEPGTGKSTLLLQICTSLILSSNANKPLYISGEESANQVGLRARRLGVDTNKFNCAFGTNLESIYALLSQTKPSLVIIDSIQTMHYQACESAAGTVSQIRACAQMLTHWAKINNTPLIMVGHITKEGSIAGPKILEHMVDVVLYFEGERTYPFRILRSVKNRFGGTDEVGMFEMHQNGLQEIENPSKLFLNQSAKQATGIAVFPSMEGTRPLLVEIQALVVQSFMQMPRRSVVGWDPTRLSMLCAILENKFRMRISQKDIYINVAAGLKITEPASDLATALSIMSSYYNIPIDHQIIALGEISLSGELRQVSRIESRVKEAIKLGFHTVLLPASTQYTSDKIKIIKIQHLKQAHDWLKTQQSLHSQHHTNNHEEEHDRANQSHVHHEYT